MTIRTLEAWFPKVVCRVDDLDIDHLVENERNIRSWIAAASTRRDDFLQVDSTFKTNPAMHTDAHFLRLSALLLSEAEEFGRKIGYQRPGLRILHMWANVSREGDFMFPHNHKGSLISGAYYIKAPENSGLTFYDDLHAFFPTPQRLEPENLGACTYSCVAGRLLLFKSDLVHGTGKQPPGEKIVVSFNVGY